MATKTVPATAGLTRYADSLVSAAAQLSDIAVDVRKLHPLGAEGGALLHAAMQRVEALAEAITFATEGDGSAKDVQIVQRIVEGGRHA